MNEEKLMPIHPGEVLLEEFLKPMDLSQEQIASALQITTEEISKVIHGQQRITAELALRLAYFFKMSPRFWLGLQMDYHKSDRSQHFYSIVKPYLQFVTNCNF